MQLEPPDNNPNPAPAQVPAKRVRLIRGKISQHVIDQLNARHEKIVLAASDVARQVIELGGMLTRVKDRMRPGKWIPFVERNLDYSIRTVQRYMRAYKERNHFLDEDAAEFMARIWGNEPKQLEEGKELTGGKNDVDVVSDDDETDEEDEDVSQHGGPGFQPGFFPDKGKVGLDSLKHVVASLDRQFLDSEDLTLEAKLTFLTELVNWLEARRAVFAARLQRKEERKD